MCVCVCVCVHVYIQKPCVCKTALIFFLLVHVYHVVICFLATQLVVEDSV